MPNHGTRLRGLQSRMDAQLRLLTTLKCRLRFAFNALWRHWKNIEMSVGIMAEQEVAAALEGRENGC